MTSPAANVITRLRSALGSGADGPTDTALLARFATAGDEGAFELLVWRHAGMVLRVCRSILHDHHAAEDASQAAFLALARQAATVCRRGTVAGWLYRVAWRIAAKAARRQRPQVSPDLSEFPVRELDPVLDPTLAAVLHEELARLSEQYRVPLILCFFEGLTHAQAARQLGWPIGTLAVRVARAKKRLARRLTQRGVAVPAAGLAALIVADPAAGFVESTVRAAVAFAVGGETIAGISKTVVLQAQGVIRTMTMSKLLSLGGILVVSAALASAVWAGGQRADPASVSPTRGLGVGAERGTFPDKTKPAVLAPVTRLVKESGQTEGINQFVEGPSWTLRKIDPDKRTLSAVLLSTPAIHDLFDGHPEVIPTAYAQSALLDFPFAKNAKVFINGREAELKDLRMGMRATVRLARDKAAISRLDATSIAPQYVLKSTDVEKNTITITTGTGEQLTLPLTGNTKYWLVVNREIQFTDLKAGMLIEVQLTVVEGKIVVSAVRAYPPVKK